MAYQNYIVGTLLALTFAGCGGAQIEENTADDFRVVNLKCEYLADPIGIDVREPRLSWVVEAEGRGWKQSAWQVLVASSIEKLDKEKGDVWDSGKFSSDGSIHVIYGGTKLQSGGKYYWKVRVWDENGRASAYSKPAMWEMGLLEDSDWRARWISGPKRAEDEESAAAPFMRKTFRLSKSIRSARVYISGVCYYELYLNGKRIGDQVLDPAFTRYDKRVLYVTYDVTDNLKRGDNAIGVVLGNGWYNALTKGAWQFDRAKWRQRPALLCQLAVEFSDGSWTTIVSDGSWKTTIGPIVFNAIRQGTTYDARLEMPGWNTVAFDDSKWVSAEEVEGPAGNPKAQMMPPVKVVRTIKPVKVTEPQTGIYVFDLGQNFSGWVQLTLAGPAGSEVVMKYSEKIDDKGNIDLSGISNLARRRDSFQTDTYILKGEGVETWESAFAYHGFRYVQVTGFPGKPTLDSLRGRVVHTAFERAGKFECSNELLNRIQQNALWSYVSNFVGYPTDCPHREKNGWTGDAQLAAEMGLYNFHSAAAYTKWMADFRDEQPADGQLPGIIPTSGWGYGYYGSPAWGSACILIPWYMYEHRGDERILAEQYENMKLFVKHLTNMSTDNIVKHGLGDWCPPEGNEKMKCPKTITSTGYYYINSLIISKAAAILGKNEEAKEYAELAEQIRKSYNEHLYEGDGVYVSGCQTALSCPVFQGIVEPGEKDKVIEKLVAEVKKRNRHIDTGILGAKYLFRVLTENGHAELAYELATQTTYPSYGNWLERGATTLWEMWDGGGSQNHIMFGDISAWFYKALAGIDLDSQRPAFKHIIIRPYPVGDLKWAKAEHESMYGLIRSSWRKDGEAFTLDVTIPANTTATVYVPAMDAASAGELSDIKPSAFEGGRAIFEVGSGNYSFQSKMPAKVL